MSVHIPAATCWSVDDPGFAALVGYAWNRLGACAGDGESGLTFYSQTHTATGNRGLVGSDGPKADFLDALQGDDVVYVDCHGWTDVAGFQICGGVTVADILALPDGGLAESEFVYLSCCDSLCMHPGDPTSMGHAMTGKGATCVAGYFSSDFAPSGPGDFFNHRLWVYWTGGETIEDGILFAKQDMLAEYGDLSYAANIMTTGPAATYRVIAPAFQFAS